MQQSIYFNIHAEYHPNNRLLRYSKASKLSRETLQKLLYARRTYSQLPPIIYSVQNTEENKDISLEYDIFDQKCNITLNDPTSIWHSTGFYIPDSIFIQIKNDIVSRQIDNDTAFLSFFPIYTDMNRKKRSILGRQDDEIYLPSTLPSADRDIYQLQERFHMMLYNEQALEIGLCSKRRRIYDDLLDELIRIIGLQCLERGLLLARIKNEYVRWMNIYEQLYKSGMAYGLRQYLYKTQENQNYEYMIKHLENDCQTLRKEIDAESKRIKRLKELFANDTELNEQQRQAKVNAGILKSTNAILRRDLQNALNNILSSNIFVGESINYDIDEEKVE